jgi:hypothetical protein
MPKGINNWEFDDAVSFLKQHFFVCVNVEGSHYYFRGLIDNLQKLTDIHRHNKKTYPPLTMKCIIHKSGIPEKIWREWASAGNKKSRRHIQYQGAKNWKQE